VLQHRGHQLNGDSKGAEAEDKEREAGYRNERPKVDPGDRS